MVSSWNLEEVIEGLTLDSDYLNPFGERYPLDRRYKVWCLCGCGNGHHDRLYGHVGGVQFELYIDYDAKTCKCRLLKRDEYFTSVSV